jgi:tetrapyrrole methylase family protein/MazG family protein
MAVYPDDHAVQLVHGAGTSNAVVEKILLYELDRSTHVGLQTTLYLPPLEENTSFEAFQEIVAHLRAPEGCPWDKEQTHQTLRPFLVEEAYEVVSALDADDPDAMREELGDLLLQIVLHAQIGSELGEFGMAEVLSGINEKLVRRHPHVFGDLSLDDAEKVVQNWERLKSAERETAGNELANALEGVSLSLPALFQAQTYQGRASRAGFDWQVVAGVKEKITEELAELDSAGSHEEREIELGDLLFSIVNLARWMGIDAETALRSANNRFRDRFAAVERSARKANKSLSDYSMEELEALWEAVKKRG